MFTSSQVLLCTYSDLISGECIDNIIRVCLLVDGKLRVCATEVLVM